MSGHTPGPWVGMVNGKFDSDNDWCAEDTKAESSEYAPIWAGGKVIALVVNSGNFCGLKAHPSIEANAALIAAAPELLEALVNLRDFAVMSNARAIAYLDAGNQHPVEVAQAAIFKATGGAA